MITCDHESLAISWLQQLGDDGTWHWMTAADGRLATRTGTVIECVLRDRPPSARPDSRIAPDTRELCPVQASSVSSRP